MNFKTYENLTDCIIKNLHKIPRDVDLIVGIPRSGTMVANILALYLNLPFTDIDKFVSGGLIKTGSTRKCKNWIKEISEAKHVLIVDDSVSSGKAINETKEFVKKNGVGCRITYLAVYALAASCRKVDIYFELCEQPRMFEWNYMHHWALEYCCMDINNIILEKVRQRKIPKFIPTQKVGGLIVCGLEENENTEEWLKEYGIEYNNISLVKNGSNIAEEIARIYKKSKYILFFEYDEKMAQNICVLSGKPVFCVSSRKLMKSDNICANLVNNVNEERITWKRIIKKIFGKITYVK